MTRDNGSHERLAGTIRDELRWQVRERNLEKPLSDFMMMFLSEHRQEWTVFIKERALPVFLKSMALGYEQARKEMQGDERYSEEERSHILAFLDEQREDLLSHAEKHFCFEDEDYEHARRIFAKYADGTIVQAAKLDVGI